MIKISISTGSFQPETLLFFLHLSEQYFTSSHTLCHFFRQEMVRLHTIQLLAGRKDLLPLKSFMKKQQSGNLFVGLVNRTDLSVYFAYVIQLLVFKVINCITVAAVGFYRLNIKIVKEPEIFIVDIGE